MHTISETLSKESTPQKKQQQMPLYPLYYLVSPLERRWKFLSIS
jgi:hypothetical protein